eukprot:6206876-Ditylum_brightwellii.AAC.1
MGMMLHMQKQTLAASLKDSGSCKSVNNLCKSFTNLHNLDKTFNHIVPEFLKLLQSGSVDVSERKDNAFMSATNTKATSTSNISLIFVVIKRTYLDTSSISGIFLHYHTKNLEQAYLDYSETFASQGSKERN